MVRQRVCSALLVAAFLVGLAPVEPAFADASSQQPGLGAYADHDSEYLWATQRAGGGAKDTAAGQVGRRVIQLYVPACQGTLAQARRDLATPCGQAFGVCASTPAPNDLGYWIYTAPAGPPAPGPGDWTSTGQIICRSGNTPATSITHILTAADFRRLPLPAAGLMVQPPNRSTLINIPTNLYADATAVILTTRILGIPIRVRATPLTFRWNYGDGNTLSTPNAGGPYPRLDTAHTYRQPGTRTVQLTTSYAGEFALPGGPWQPVIGTATVASTPLTLTVHAAQAHLVG